MCSLVLLFHVCSVQSLWPGDLRNAIAFLLSGSKRLRHENVLWNIYVKTFVPSLLP